MASKLLRFCILLFSVILLPIVSFAYNDWVHYPVTVDAILLSGIENYLQEKLQIKSTDVFTSDKFPTTSKPDSINAYDKEATGNFKSLMMEGALREDRPVYRTGNHFYDPTTGSKLTDGKNTMFALDSALDRATGAGMYIDWKNALGQQTKPYRLSWPYAREYFHKALTLLSKVERDKNWGNLFLSLGNIVHLLQDMSVPSHVRNDSHGFKEEPDVYEPWCDTNPIATLGYDAVKLPKLADFWDTGIDKGLAEFTNANFFSRDSNIDNFFDHSPSYSKPIVLLEDQGVQEEIKNDSGKVIGTVNVRYGYGIVYDAYTNATYPDVPLTAYSLWDFEVKKKVSERVYSLNDKIHKTYADFLLPRAVGYSAGLLDYFFRGTLEITNPDRCLYGIIDGSAIPQQFKQIKAKVKNTTPNEAMQSGILQAVARYKKRTDYQPDLSTDPPTSSSAVAFSYSVSTPKSITSLDSSNPTEFTFDFSGSPIPAGVTDLYLQVIFKGTLGNETDTAVAVGMKDLSEPMHHVHWNLTDRFYLDGVLRTADEIRSDPLLLNRVTPSGEPIDSYPVKTEIAFCPATGQAPAYNVTYDSMPAGAFGRVITIVGADQIEFPLVIHRTSISPPHELTSNFLSPNIINQDDNGVFENAQVLTFRGVGMHAGSGYLRYYPVPPSSGLDTLPYPVVENKNPISATTLNP